MGSSLSIQLVRFWQLLIAFLFFSFGFIKVNLLLSFNMIYRDDQVSSANADDFHDDFHDDAHDDAHDDFHDDVHDLNALLYAHKQLQAEWQ